MRHLVLGSSGVIGKALVNFLRSKNYQLEGHNNSVLTCDIHENPFHDLTISNNTLVEDKIRRADFVYFLAYDVGGSKYLESNDNTLRMLSNNLKMTVNTFELLKKYNKPFIFASSQMSNMEWSAYGQCKAVGEHYAKLLDGLIVKFWNVYGPEDIDEKSHVISDFIDMAVNNKCITMRTTGTEKRQFLHCEDSAKALYNVYLNRGKFDSSTPLHITSFNWVSIKDVAKTVSNVVGDISIIPGDKVDSVQMDKQNEPDEFFLKYWRPEITLQEGIKKIYNES